MQNTPLDAACRLPLTERPVILVADAEGLDEAVRKIAWIVLPRVQTYLNL